MKARAFVCLVILLALASCVLRADSEWSYEQMEDTSAHSVVLRGVFTIAGTIFGSTDHVDSLTVFIANPADSLTSVIWDESALVLPGGTSARVIHTGVRIVDQAAPQAPTAIAPKSRTIEAIWPVSHVDTDGDTHGISLHDGCVIKLFLTIQNPSGKATEEWIWRFSERGTREPEKPPSKPVHINWWIWGPILLGLYILGLYVQAMEAGYL